jgi:LPXTG-motif cell wall-anchored protein
VTSGPTNWREAINIAAWLWIGILMLAFAAVLYRKWKKEGKL